MHFPNGTVEVVGSVESGRRAHARLRAINSTTTGSTLQSASRGASLAPICHDAILTNKQVKYNTIIAK